MILINSSPRDVSTTQVVRYLKHQNKHFVRLNDTAYIQQIFLINNNFVAVLDNGEKIDVGSLTSYWYRRGQFKYHIGKLDHSEHPFISTYNEFCLEELKSVFDYFLDSIKQNIPAIGDSRTCLDVNKHIILSKANKLGLLTPDYLITDNKNDIISFKKKWGRIISKPLNSSFFYTEDDYWYPVYTEEITDEVIKESPDTFELTLFQNLIEKHNEIRTFYLNGRCYSMAIFSQKDPQTKIDFRVYNHTKPNRTVPFNLPVEIEEKLDALMKDLAYESGSIDLLYTPDKKFYFLEVNPVGQFGSLSHTCNYNIEKQIANALTDVL